MLCNCDGASKIGGTACAAHNVFPFMSSFNDRRSFWTSSVNTPTTLITRTRSATRCESCRNFHPKLCAVARRLRIMSPGCARLYLPGSDFLQTAK